MELVFILFTMLFAVALVFVKHKTVATGKFNYRKRPALSTPAEAKFFAVLDQALSHIIGKSRDLI